MIHMEERERQNMCQKQKDLQEKKKQTNLQVREPNKTPLMETNDNYEESKNIQQGKRREIGEKGGKMGGLLIYLLK